MRLSATPDLHINAFSGGGITELESGIINGMVEKRGDILYLTQRPSIDVFEDASNEVSDARGRGIYYWESQSAIYLLNDGTLYKSSHANSISTSPTAGTTKAKFMELGNRLIMLDAENNEGWTITTSDVVAQIASNFPSTLAHGGAVLDQYAFVMDPDGVIYHSNRGDSTTWGALDFLEAEREEDGGVYLGKHHDTIVAYGVSTVEFFYNAQNATGSVLAPRQDVQYNLGCSSGTSVWEEGDRSFFVGTNFSGALGVYSLERFQVRKVSTASLDSFLSTAVVKDGFFVNGSGVSAHGHIFYLLTLYHLSEGDIVPDITLVYDDTVGIWGEWDITINGLDKYPLMAWTKRQGETAKFGEGILANGDLISINDNLLPQDTLLASTYVDVGYVDVGYVTDIGSSGTNIVMKSRIGMFDAGTDNEKNIRNLRHVGDICTGDLTIRWANEQNVFNTGRAVDLSKYQKLNRMGRFRRRNHELEYSGANVLRIEALEGDLIAT